MDTKGYIEPGCSALHCVSTFNITFSSIFYSNQRNLGYYYIIYCEKQIRISKNENFREKCAKNTMIAIVAIIAIEAISQWQHFQIGYNVLRNRISQQTNHNIFFT